MLFPVLGVKGQMSTAKTPAACTNNGKPVLVIIISHYYTVSPPSVELCICRDRVCLSPGALLQIGPSHGTFSLSLSLCRRLLFALFLRQYWLSCETSQGRIIVSQHPSRLFPLLLDDHLLLISFFFVFLPFWMEEDLLILFYCRVPYHLLPPF